MAEIITYSLLDFAIVLIELFACTVVFAIIKGWYDNRKWEKNIYKILEEYRAKYGVDQGCEMLLYREANEND